MPVESVMPGLLSVVGGAGDAPSCELGFARGDPGQQLGLGVLTCQISPETVNEVIESSGCREKRRRLLPAQTVIYFVLGLCLFSGADSMAHYRDTARCGVGSPTAYVRCTTWRCRAVRR